MNECFGAAAITAVPRSCRRAGELGLPTLCHGRRRSPRLRLSATAAIYSTPETPSLAARLLLRCLQHPGIWLASGASLSRAKQARRHPQAVEIQKHRSGWRACRPTAQPGSTRPAQDRKPTSDAWPASSGHPGTIGIPRTSRRRPVVQRHQVGAPCVINHTPAMQSAYYPVAACGYVADDGLLSTYVNYRSAGYHEPR